MKLAKTQKRALFGYWVLVYYWFPIIISSWLNEGSFTGFILKSTFTWWKSALLHIILITNYELLANYKRKIYIFLRTHMIFFFHISSPTIDSSYTPGSSVNAKHRSPRWRKFLLMRCIFNLTCSIWKTGKMEFFLISMDF